MPTAGLSFPCGPAQVTFDQTGWVTSLVHRREPELSYLAGAMVSSGWVGPDPLERVAPTVLADLDEVEFHYTYPGLLRVVVRHTFAAGWSVRIVCVSLAPDTLPVAGLQLRLDPPPGCVAWALALGATASYAVSPASGTGPLLGGVLRQGSLLRATSSGLELTPFELRAGDRYVVQLHWDWYQSPRAFGQARYGEAPSALFSFLGDAVHVRVDEDVAVVASDGVLATQEGRRLEVVAEAPGPCSVELRSARGTTAFEIEWVEPVAELLATLAQQTMAGLRTAAGVVKLADVAAALVLQHGLALGQVDDHDDAADALDLFTARLGDPGTRGALEAAYLGREFDRLGEVDLLVQAEQAVLAQPTPTPGLGIAATQLCLGLIVSGRPVDAVLRHLARLARQVTTSGFSPEHGVAEQAAALEVVAVTDAGPGASGAGAAAPNPAGHNADLTPWIAALGLHLGAGLKGRAVVPLPPGELSHLITVFGLLPDQLSGSMTKRWGCSPQTLARRATPELLARLARAPIGQAHAWLVLAVPST